MLGGVTSQPHVLSRPKILHVCGREALRPLRDQVLKVSGFEVESTNTAAHAFTIFWRSQYDLVLIDVENEKQAMDALTLCEQIKERLPDQTIAYACNWRVSIESDCPDQVIRTEFNPDAFVAGVRQLLKPN